MRYTLTRGGEEVYCRKLILAIKLRPENVLMCMLSIQHNNLLYISSPLMADIYVECAECNLF